MSKNKKKRPWWVGERWSVQAVSNCDMPHRNVNVGDWVDIYTAKTRKEANADAKAWTEKTGQPTRVVPGKGHPKRR